MAENNPPGNNGPGNNRKVSNNSNFFRMRHRLQNGRNTGPKQRTVSLLIPQSSSSNVSSPSNSASSGPTPPSASFQINKASGPYCGWQLYFPEIGTHHLHI